MFTILDKLVEPTVWLSVALLLSVVILVLIIIRRKYDYFVTANIPGPPPTLLLGNLGTLWRTSKYFRQLETWTRQYGKIYGMFEGTLPIYVVSDVDFLEEVLIKQFSNFSARKPMLFLLAGHEKRVHLATAVGSQWRRQRYVINPIFSKAKLMLMSPLINECVDELIHVLGPYADRNVEVNVRPIYARMTMDSVCRCAFSLDTDVQRNSNNLYFKKISELLSIDLRKLFFLKLIEVLPSFVGIFIFRIVLGYNALLFKLNEKFPFLKLNELPLLWLLARIGEQAVHVRRNISESKRVDLLHLMLKAVTDKNISDLNEHDDDDESMMASSKPSSSTLNKLTYDEIQGNVFGFFFAGTEAASITLAYCTYVLANHEDVQKKLQEEIDSSFNDADHLSTYDAVEKLTYLDMFIKEINRMYPIAVVANNRLCVQDTTIGKHKIKKGTVIQSDLYSIHYDMDLWGPVDPYKFYPERHATKRHPLALQTFGAGPRNCVGMRFALLELKIALVALVKTFTVHKTDKLKDTVCDFELTTIMPDQVTVKLERRMAAM